jgi:hypothetical protein
MKVKPARAKKKGPTQVTIGLRGFAQFSAVEGLMWADFREFDARRLSNAERRKPIARKDGVIRSRQIKRNPHPEEPRAARRLEGSASQGSSAPPRRTAAGRVAAGERKHNASMRAGWCRSEPPCPRPLATAGLLR